MKEIGIATTEELKEIEKIYQRKLALSSLFLVLSSNVKGIDSNSNEEAMYEKVVNDMAEVQVKMNKWWKRVSLEHDWEYSSNQAWEVDFTTGKIILHTV